MDIGVRIFVAVAMFLVLGASKYFVASTCVASGSILTLTMTSNRSLTQVPNFTTCDRATTVNLSFNAIRSLQDHMFDRFYMLLVLDLSHNNITSLPAHILTSHWRLEVFNVADNYITTVPSELLDNKHRLKHIDFSNNRISKIPLRAFNYSMPDLKTVDLSHNSLLAFEPWPYVGSLDSLERFDLRWNKIHEFVNTQNWTLSVGHLKSNARVDLRFNNLTAWRDSFLLQYFNPARQQGIEVVLGQLNFDMRNNVWHCDCHVHNVARKMQTSFYGPQYRDWVKCATPAELHGVYLFNRDSLTHLNALVCVRKDDCPKGCTCLDVPEDSLISIDCSGLGLDRFPDYLPSSPYQNIKLNLNDNKITTVEKTNYTEYIVELRIANNSVNVIDLDALKVMSNKINSIDLSMNRLSSVPKGFEVLQFKSVKLSQNPFKCNCDMTWMREWVNAETSLECTAEGNKKYRITDITDEILDCNNTFPIWVAIVFSVLLVGVIVLLIIAKRCPYETKVLLFKMFMIHPSDKYEIDNEDGMDYDLYVSCDEDDIHVMQWVRRTLAVHLEDRKPSFKLCIPLRDLPRGVPEAHARLDCLEKSRRLVVILTDGYARNEWSSFELNQSDVLSKGSGRVFFILYDQDGETMARREPWSSKMTERKVFSPDDRMFWSKVRYEMPTKRK